MTDLSNFASENPDATTGLLSATTVVSPAGKILIFGSGDDDVLPGYLRSRDDAGTGVRLFGLDGDDVLRDMPLTVHMFGGEGADTFRMARDNDLDSIKDFELGIDRIDLSAWGVSSTAELTIEMTRSDKVAISLAGTDEILTVTNYGRTLRAEDFTDDVFIFRPAIQGTDGWDHLRGTSRHDVLKDGAGSDNMWGGFGADLFVMDADGQADTIRDFANGFDRIDISAWSPDPLSFADLEVTDIGRGKIVVSYGGEKLTLRAHFGTLTTDQIDATDFLL